MRNVLQKILEKIKTHILILIFFFSKIMQYVEKYGRPNKPQMTVNYGAHALHAG